MIRRLAAACLTAGLVLAAVAVFAQEGPDIDGLMKKFFDASDEKARSQAISLIEFSGASSLEIEKHLRAGRKYSEDVETGWQVLYNKCTDGKKRPYHLYVPENYDPKKKYPIFFDLHGGVSRPAIVSIEQMKSRRSLWGLLAKEKGFILIIPHGEKDALWWNKVGTDNLLQQIDYVKRNYSVDENKVFLSGFSDGASGCFWMGFHKPTSLAGLIPLSGNIMVSKMGPYQCYPRNLLNRPIHATNGGKDRLYPSDRMKKLIDPLKELGVDIDWTAYPEAGHSMSYFKTEMPRVMEFVEKTSRNPAPSHVIWETADTEAGRCDWVRIGKIEDVGNNLGFEDINLIVGPGRLVLGVVIDTQFGGPGVRIQDVQKGSVADKAGLKAGDVITKLDETDIADRNDLTRVLRAKKFGDTIKGEFKRGDETKQFSGQFAKPEPRPLFRREKTAGSIEVKAEGNLIDVKVRNVAKYTLLINRKQFNLDEPIRVVTNGDETFNAKVSPDMRFMLEQAGRDNDRAAVYCDRIEITVPQEEKDENKEEEPEKGK